MAGRSSGTRRYNGKAKRFSNDESRRRAPRRRNCGLFSLSLTASIVATALIVHNIFMAPIPLSEPASIQMVHFNAPTKTRASLLPPSNISCSSMTEIKKGTRKVTFAQVNELRRHLLMENRPCFQSNSQFFIETFLNRTSANHVMLHIPKTGGSTLCKQVEKGEILSTTVRSNCWKESFCPMWAGCVNPQPTSCSTLQSWPETFLMNENYLDQYCDHHTYSILIREPVSRAISHLNHFMEALAWRKNYPYEHMKWRLSLVMSNYMVWALTAITLFDVHSNSTDTIHAKDLHPNEKDLTFAKQRLMQMDYLVDLRHENAKCRDQMLTHMKIGTILGEANKGSAGYERDFRRNDIAAANKLDLELYSFAQDLIDADCVFYEMIHGMQQNNSEN